MKTAEALFGEDQGRILLDDGNVLLRFKDTVTGADGRIGSGANQVIGEVGGKGNASPRTTVYFFELLGRCGILTHFIGPGRDFGYGPDTMVARRARSFKLEVICREKAWGSFVRRYGDYVTEGTPLLSLAEVTLKDDRRGDPLITEDALVALSIVSRETVEYRFRATA